MTIELAKEEKINIIESHQKDVMYNKYNIELSLLQENAKSTPDEIIIAKLNSNIAELIKQIEALQIEIDKLN